MDGKRKNAQRQKMNWKKIAMFIVGALMLLMTIIAAHAAETTINMKTNDIYTAQFNIANNNDANGTLKNCLPYLTGDLNNADWADTKPNTFDLPYGSNQDLVLTLTYPPVGYYTGRMGVRCERYHQEKFVGIYDVVSTSDAPQYTILVALAGAGQSYYFTSHTYNFISKPGLTEKAQFTIANTGTIDLPTKFNIPPEYQGIITIDPQVITIPIKQTQIFTVNVKVPNPFNSFNATIPVIIGDYGDKFTITGEIETIATTGVAVQSIGGSTTIAGVKIPTWIIVVGIIIGIILLVRWQKPKKRKKK